MNTMIFDCETTGLIDNRTLRDERLPEVIEFYAVVCDLGTGETFWEIDTLVRPTRGPITPEITKITGIKPSDVFGSPSFSEIVGRVGDIIAEADQVLAHNCSFDCEILDIEFDRLGLRIDWPEKICTVEQSLWYQGRRLTLGRLHEHLFGEKFEGAHRAKTDVQALMRCAIEMKKRGDL